MLHFEMSRCCRFLSMSRPGGKIPSLLCERSSVVSLGKTERLTKFVNLFWDKLRDLIDENWPKYEPILNPMVPTSMFLDRLISTKVGMDQNQLGTWPLRKLLEKSIDWRWDMFLRYFQETEPFRFRDERFMLVKIFGVLQLGSCGVNQEESKPETELKALLSRSWSAVMLHVDSPRMIYDKKTMDFNNNSFIFM